MRGLATGAAALYLVQVLAGGLVVLLLAPPWLSALHAVLAQITFALVFVMIPLSSLEESSSAERGTRLAGLLLWTVLLQIVLGATSRHPPAGEALFIASMLLHLLVALVVLGLAIAVVVALSRAPESRRARSTAVALLVLIVLQFGVGLPLFVIAPEPGTDEHLAPRAFSYLHIAHVMLAGLTLAHAAALRLRLRPPASTLDPAAVEG